MHHRAEIGENSGLYVFGFSPAGVIIAYAMGYMLAGFTTFASILGRYNGEMACGCCSVLEQGARKGFIANISGTIRDFVVGVVKLRYLNRQPNLKQILKSSITILVMAESACILMAEMVDLVFYQHWFLLSVLLALLAGAFTVMPPEAYRKTRVRS